MRDGSTSGVVNPGMDGLRWLASGLGRGACVGLSRGFDVRRAGRRAPS